MKETYYIGIDPGKQGGIAALNEEGELMQAFGMTKQTEREISNFLYTYRPRSEDYKGEAYEAGRKTFAILEKVASSPQMGVTSAFTFGRGYGFLRGLLMGFKIPFNDVSPSVWQRKLGCLTKGDKNVSKGKAEQLFPGISVTHAIADALLIAYYLKNFYTEK